MEGSQHGLQPQLAGWRRGSLERTPQSTTLLQVSQPVPLSLWVPSLCPCGPGYRSPWGSPRCSAQGGYELRVEEPSSALLGAHTPWPVPHQATLALVLNSALSQQAYEDEQRREQQLELGKANSMDSQLYSNRMTTRP